MTEVADKQANTWGMLCHLTALSGFIIPFGHVLGPLIVWLIKKDEFPFVDDQGKESLNFQISMTIYTFVAIILCFALVGFILAPALMIANIVFVILAGVKANTGEPYRYPCTIRFIK